MANSLSNLVDNLPEGLHRINCKLGYDGKKCKACGIKYKYCDCFLEYTNFKDDLIEYKWLSCSKTYQGKLDISSLTMTIISLFYYYENVFILKNIWMIAKI